MLAFFFATAVERPAETTWPWLIPSGPRFAAKEAAIKAHPSLRLTFHRIIVARCRRDGEGEGEGEGDKSNNKSDDAQVGTGPPIAIVRGASEGALAQEALISISHDGDYATAVCLGFEAGRYYKTAAIDGRAGG